MMERRIVDGRDRRIRNLLYREFLERRISEIAGKKTVVSGSGRTDSGVHALGQECSLYLEQEIDMDSFKKR